MGVGYTSGPKYAEYMAAHYRENYRENADLQIKLKPYDLKRKSPYECKGCGAPLFGLNGEKGCAYCKRSAE